MDAYGDTFDNCYGAVFFGLPTPDPYNLQDSMSLRSRIQRWVYSVLSTGVFFRNSNRLLGRWSPGSGSGEEISIGAGLTLENGELSATGGGGGGGTTNLGFTESPTQGVVTSDTGDDATIPAGSTSNASLMLPADKTKLDGVEPGATGDQSGAEIVSAIDSQLGGADWQSGGANGTDGVDGQVLGDSAGEFPWPIQVGTDPRTMPSLAAHYLPENYDAATGVWTDSVAGNNFECLDSNLPTLDGRFVDFSAGNTLLAGDSVANDYDETLINSKNFSFVMLCRHTAGQVGPRVILTSASQQQTGFRALSTGGSIQSQANAGGDPSQSLRMGSGEATAFYVEVTNNGANMIVTIRTSSGSFDTYVASTAGLPTFNRIGIGCDLRDGSLSPNYGQGGIAEMAFFDRPLSEAEAVSVMRNLIVRHHGNSIRSLCDVYLLAGSREMDGGSAGALSGDATDAEVLYRNSDSTNGWTLADGLRGADSTSDWGLEVGLGRAAKDDADLSTNRAVAVFKHAPPSSITNDNWDPEGVGGETDRFITRAVQFLNVLVAEGYQPVLRGLAWAGGSTDAASMEDSNAYEANVRKIVARVRDALGAPTLPAVVVQTIDEGSTYIDTVRSAQLSLGANLTRSATVSGDDQTEVVGGKWDSPGQLTVGERIYLKFKLPSSSWLAGMTFEERFQLALDEAMLGTNKDVVIPPGNYSLNTTQQVTLRSGLSVSAYGCTFRCPTTLSAGQHVIKMISDGDGLTDFEWRGGRIIGQVFDQDRNDDWTSNTVQPSSYFGFIDIEDVDGDSARLTFADIKAFEVPGLVVFVKGRGGTDGNGVPIRVEDVTIRSCDFDRCGQYFQDRFFTYHLALWPDEFPAQYDGLYEVLIDPADNYGVVAFDSVTDRATKTGPITLSNNAQVMFGGPGTLPTGIVKGKAYYVRNISGSTFQISETSGGAAINLTNNGSGELRAVKNDDAFAPYQVYPEHNGAWGLWRCRNVRVDSVNWSSQGDGHRVTQCEGVRISNFTVGPTRMGALFLSTGNTDVLITNGQINGGNGSRMISVETDNDRVLIENLYGYNGGRGIWLNEAREVTIRNSHFENICQKAGNEDDVLGFPKWRRTAAQDGEREVFDDLYATSMRGSHTIENVTMRQTSGNQHLMSFSMSSPRRLILRNNISNTASAEAHVTGTPSSLVESGNINLTVIDD